MSNSITWFEIPVTDLERAMQFYREVFQIKLEVTPVMNGASAFFPHMEGPNDVGGSLTQGEGYTPSMGGTLVYMNANPDVAPILARVEAAGGKVLMPKTSIGENGYIGIFTDSEGNRVGVHSRG